MLLIGLEMVGNHLSAIRILCKRQIVVFMRKRERNIRFWIKT